MDEQQKRKAYAISFVSYLIRNSKHFQLIGQIILYGSVAKSQSTSESDIDIFIIVKKETQLFKKEINNILEEFYKSKDAIIFKLQSVDNIINIKIGKLENWQDLKKSIASDGIILWGKYITKQKSKDTEHKIIFFWDIINLKRTSFLNKLYGFKTKERYYNGLLKECNGEKLGKNCILVPIQFRDEIILVLKRYKVNAKSIEVFC
ncbi:nucleotidyltransferase domain-containing protein [Candidatus Woesearchaeota archaeon]|nr:nucleotidyltransferase domain-containing protein [Candidatus Woesearchaeota archaeon]